MQAGFRVVSVSSASKRVAAPASIKPKKLYKDAATQSLYRDSQSQTDPYRPAGTPNTTANFGSEEKDAKPTDEASVELKRQIPHEQSVHERQHREQQLDGNPNPNPNLKYDETLTAFEATARSRAEARERELNARIEAARELLLINKQEKAAQIQRRGVRAARKLSDERKCLWGRKGPRDIVAEYAESGGKPRGGAFGRRRHTQGHTYKPTPLTVEEISAIEESIPTADKVLLQRLVKSTVVRGHGERASVRLQEQLESMSAQIKAAKLTSTELRLGRER